ncbi:MAG: amino acid ABC transporter ATP-binding protein [Ruminococcaceae bacterium]|nr:amino acid ABC transporter ATP-binding protein [Oscillospiraceae bacterium]
MEVLRVENIRKNFGKTEVLKGIDFTLQKGEVLSIIGSSGSGKTTLLRCLNFLETPQVGRIAVGGEVLFDAAEHRKYSDAAIRQNRLHFGLVFQQFNLFPQYTVKRNITLAEELLAKEKIKKEGSYDGHTTFKEAHAAIEEKAERLLEEVGLSQKKDSYPCQLSGGQQQRVAIARALAMEPDILCFDEPTSALDPELTGEVLRVIRELKETGRTMVIVTHEIEFARDVSDTVMFMDEGVVAEMGPPSQVIGAPRNERTREFLARFNER